jgi:hypothetical protein
MSVESLSPYCCVEKEDLALFLSEISIQEPTEKDFSLNFVPILLLFIQYVRQGIITKRRFEEISKSFLLWASYQEQAKLTGQNDRKEEVLFELPIAEMIAGRASEEGRFIGYILTIRKEADKALKKAEDGKMLNVLMAGNELQISKLAYAHFAYAVYPMRWETCLYLVGQMSDAELAEAVLSFPFDKKSIAEQLSSSLTYVTLLRELWTLGKMVQFMDIIKNIGSRGFSDLDHVKSFCMENGLTELFAEAEKEALEKAEKVCNGSMLENEERSSAEKYSEELRELVMKNAGPETDALKTYEKAYKFASSFYDNALYELGVERTKQAYGERKEFMRTGLKAYLSNQE